MDFESFHKQAWADHATKTEHVAQQLLTMTPLVKNESELVQLIGLATHVYGEHLGRWQQGLEFLTSLKSHASLVNESELALRRSIASLELASGLRESLPELSVSDQVRALAVAASALSEQKRTGDARGLVDRALSLASSLTTRDPAHRALAVTGNNLASTLEEKTERTSDETELMIAAALMARRFWEMAGTWLQVERAEYRLSRSFEKAARLDEAQARAQACLDICVANNAPALEFFFAHESLALIAKARGDTAELAKNTQEVKRFFDKLEVGEKSWCQATLVALETLCATSSYSLSQHSV